MTWRIVASVLGAGCLVLLGVILETVFENRDRLVRIEKVLVREQMMEVIRYAPGCQAPCPVAAGDRGNP